MSLELSAVPAHFEQLAWQSASDALTDTAISLSLATAFSADSEAAHDYLRVHAFLDERLGVSQELAGEEHDRSGAVADFGVLRERNVDKGFSRRVDNVKELHDGRTIVRDGGGAVVMDELVHTARCVGVG